MPGVLFCVFAVYFTGVIFVGFLILIFRMNQTKGKERKQLFGFILATSLGFVGGGLTLPPVFGMEVPQYAIFLMPLYPFLTAFFMMKKGLFDLDDLAQAAHRDKLTAIGVLAASINHEVKNPLFVIKGLAESCLERQKEGIFSTEKKVIESANDAMQRSIEQADRAMDIIKRLSLFAKAGIEGEMKFESVSVSEVMENILPLVRYELAVHSITLTRDIPKDLPDVHADRRYLEEIFFNLIVNAIQALRGRPKPGEIKITAREGDSGLETRNSSCSNNRVSSYEERVPVIITIQDNGPGIPADKLKDVFRPFYTTKAEGTGLGLYITQQLVEKIGGRIAVESQAGMGTTFTVALKANNP
jgi:signal transduction histidine kinase